MIKSKMTRHDFIKVLAGLLMAPLVPVLNKIFPAAQIGPVRHHQARFYKKADHLAG